MIRNPYLPLTETTFYILLVLTTPAHGYAIIQEIDKLSDGSVKVAAGRFCCKVFQSRPFSVKSN